MLPNLPTLAKATLGADVSVRWTFERSSLPHAMGWRQLPSGGLVLTQHFPQCAQGCSWVQLPTMPLKEEKGFTYGQICLGDMG